LFIFITMEMFELKFCKYTFFNFYSLALVLILVFLLFLGLTRLPINECHH